ncbi:histidine kinase, dimerisation and phosphoacceptor region [Shewanella denitrificans OS217]|uniref:Histidine kinase, dimerisation and phosphoacceptor region n=1 Tax=Shewanella denitrificans (strain OS217 / ATCC BAA-1090 / DSM 15013) TaxID=318161 RepID=Q12JP4_SHEDO|nr:histidine kinase [Shewanella denitrificans]ABE56332.1 histidine kinase, dimerisation and phosphoacceptor region [Shewanella denitrificans OS217]
MPLLKYPLALAEWLLILAALISWSLVSWLDLSTLQGQNFWLQSMGLCGFIGLFLLVALDILPNRHYLLIRTAILLQAALILSLLALNPNAYLAILLIIWASQLAEWFDKRQALLQLVGVNAAFYSLSAYYWNLDSSEFNLLIFSGFQLFAYSSSLAKLSEKHARLEQEQLNQQLLSTRSLLAQTSQQQERLRIARDLHDILGHQLTALSLQLEVLSHQVATETKPQVQQSQRLAKDLLANIRAVVKEKRHQTHLDLLTPLEAIMTRLPGISLRFTKMQPLQSALLAQELLCVLQEGIANAVRHGKATELELIMRQEGEQLLLTLMDNGQGGDYIPGSGLLGMQERMQAFDGKVEVKPRVEHAKKGQAHRGSQLEIRCVHPLA